MIALLIFSHNYEDLHQNLDEREEQDSDFVMQDGDDDHGDDNIDHPASW